MSSKIAKREAYYAFPKSRLSYVFNDRVPDAEAGARIKAIVAALVEGREGADPLADEAMRYERDYYQQRAAAGRASGAARNQKATPEPSAPGGSRRGGEADPAGVALVKALAKPKEGVYEVPEEKLVDFAACYCGEDGQAKTANTFRKYLRKLGPDAFREQAARFIAEVEAGEGVENRGAAFTARLCKAAGDGEGAS